MSTFSLNSEVEGADNVERGLQAAETRAGQQCFECSFTIAALCGVNATLLGAASLRRTEN